MREGIEGGCVTGEWLGKGSRTIQCKEWDVCEWVVGNGDVFWGVSLSRGWYLSWVTIYCIIG
jgi:hypothetical protein